MNFRDDKCITDITSCHVRIKFHFPDAHCLQITFVPIVYTT